MAVVVQRMVPAGVSGVLFTAKPVTGERAEMVVNASYGLGEGTVGGEITPDTFVIDRASRDVTSTTLGAKARMVVADSDSGTKTRRPPRASRETPALTPAQLRELAVCREYGIPGVLGSGTRRRGLRRGRASRWTGIAASSCCTKGRPRTELLHHPFQGEWPSAPISSEHRCCEVERGPALIIVCVAPVSTARRITTLPDGPKSSPGTTIRPGRSSYG